MTNPVLSDQQIAQVIAERSSPPDDGAALHDWVMTFARDLLARAALAASPAWSGVTTHTSHPSGRTVRTLDGKVVEESAAALAASPVPAGWRRVFDAAQAVTENVTDKIDHFEVPSHVMAALALALDELPAAPSAPAQPATEQRAVAFVRRSFEVGIQQAVAELTAAPAPSVEAQAELTDEQIITIGRRAMDKCFGAEAQHIYIAREVERALKAHGNG